MKNPLTKIESNAYLRKQKDNIFTSHRKNQIEKELTPREKPTTETAEDQEGPVESGQVPETLPELNKDSRQETELQLK